MRRREKGASLVEVAVVMPILLALAIGLAEIGFLVIDYVTVTNAARSGARTGASLNTDPGTDTAILEVVEEDLCNLEYGDAVVVRIFRANADGSMSASQNNYTASSFNCNATGHGFTCSVAEGGCNWPSTGRNNDPPDNFDRLGVRVEFTHDYVTDFLPFPTTRFLETAIMQIEPDTSVGIGA
jgi:Flp pilus assembly protein TadG